MGSSESKNTYTHQQYVKDLHEAKDVKVKSYEGLMIFAKVVKVYDGDTIHLIFKEKMSKDSKIIKERCRIAHYDSAEIKSKDKKEKKLAEEARDFLSNKIMGKIIGVKFGKNDKWGRPLVEIYIDAERINDTMIQKGYGKPYEGHGKKFMQWK